MSGLLQNQLLLAEPPQTSWVAAEARRRVSSFMLRPMAGQPTEQLQAWKWAHPWCTAA